ncbi:hypothetical protein CC1G_08021 [Coprinopsis cinerea okayama7|uniref:Uncharacterized protein n=1 Tax=Coprinopsis cinerea (strain Okayama-7 / 130 / ATCC MYA-4618 / FGSC 9003) TaxID=240176 RepID=A8NQA4_COPC7|nr:hypothetical protein CC1G_08021 [Coprinopsis cinerea okayama7\|eukprot:XP_001835512.2 hypothetical protein CC1G_08021 [Coprinopsis cinerea okayama7\
MASSSRRVLMLLPTPPTSGGSTPSGRTDRSFPSPATPRTERVFPSPTSPRAERASPTSPLSSSPSHIDGIEHSLSSAANPGAEHGSPRPASPVASSSTPVNTVNLNEYRQDQAIFSRAARFAVNGGEFSAVRGVKIVINQGPRRPRTHDERRRPPSDTPSFSSTTASSESSTTTWQSFSREAVPATEGARRGGSVRRGVPDVPRDYVPPRQDLRTYANPADEADVAAAHEAASNARIALWRAKRQELESLEDRLRRREKELETRAEALDQLEHQLSQQRASELLAQRSLKQEATSSLTRRDLEVEQPNGSSSNADIQGSSQMDTSLVAKEEPRSLQQSNSAMDATIQHPRAGSSTPPKRPLPPIPKPRPPPILVVDYEDFLDDMAQDNGAKASPPYAKDHIQGPSQDADSGSTHISSSKSTMDTVYEAFDDSPPGYSDWPPSESTAPTGSRIPSYHSGLGELTKFWRELESNKFKGSEEGNCTESNIAEISDGLPAFEPLRDDESIPGQCQLPVEVPHQESEWERVVVLSWLIKTLIDNELESHDLVRILCEQVDSNEQTARDAARELKKHLEQSEALEAPLAIHQVLYAIQASWSLAQKRMYWKTHWKNAIFAAAINLATAMFAPLQRVVKERLLHVVGAIIHSSEPEILSNSLLPTLWNRFKPSNMPESGSPLDPEFIGLPPNHIIQVGKAF